jgi:hypothetical protein
MDLNTKKQPSRLMDIHTNKRLLQLEAWVRGHEKVKGRHEMYLLGILLISLAALALSVVGL